MKIITLVFAIFLSYSVAFGQKKNTATKLATPSAILAKSNNLSVVLIKNNLFLFIDTKAGKKDTILLKVTDPKIIPSDVKITSFSAKATPLFLISWLEKRVTQTKLKTEEATTAFSEICELSSKTKIFSNANTVTKIAEIHFLDTKQTVSETIEKMKREGFELVLSAEGDLVLKNKTQQNKMTYNKANNKFENAVSSKKNK